MALKNIDKAEASSHKFVDYAESERASEALWQECSDALGQAMKDPQERRRVVGELEENGVLPRMLLVCSGAIDLDGDGMTKEEIDAALNDTSGTYKNQTKISAAYAKEHFADIDTSEDGSLSAEELKIWQQQHQGEIHPGENSPYQENSERPYDTVPENQKQWESRLADPRASAQEKLEAVEKLHEMGVDKVTLTDEQGIARTFRIQVEPVSPGSSKQYVHLYDETGRIVLRGIGADGSYAQEVSRKGQKVGYGGDIFSKNNKDSGLARFDDFSDDD